MFVEAKDFPPGHVERAQVCVFGSGPAGMTVARSLEAKGLDVIMVEAGGFDFEDESQAFYRGTVIGDRYFDLSEARLRMFGGTSNHWGGWCIPLSPQDFGTHPGFDNAAWPITHEDLAPYIPEACEILEIGTDFSESEYTPEVQKTRFQYSSVLFGIKFRGICEESKRLRVALNSALTGLALEGTAIRSAEITSYADTSWRIEADRYILCLGGIENSRMLLWLNEQANGGLIRNGDLLGRYWSEHPQAYLGEVVFEQTGPDFYVQNKASFRLNAATQRAAGVLNAGILLQEEWYKGTKAMIADLLCVAPELGRRMMDALGQNELICGARVRSHWEQETIRDNRVALGKERDPYGIPTPELHWRRTEKDRNTVVQTTRIFADSIARHGRGRMRLADWILNDEPIPDETTMAGWHHLGGTRMSDSPASGIVDPDLRVHGIDNLYVGGSSVFASGGAGNPTLTIVKLSLRLAEHLAAGH